MDKKDYEEINICGKQFRILKERTLLGVGLLEKISLREGSVGTHEVIKVDCEILDRETKQWREVTNDDLKISSLKSQELTKKIKELRKIELDFHKTQLKSEK